MATKTAAKKTTAAKPAAKTEETVRVIKAGGKKGEAVVAALTKNPALTRTALAEEVGCTVGRVGEVIRFLAANGTKEEQALIAKHRESQPKRERKETPVATPKPAAKKAATKADPQKPAARKSSSRTARKTAAAAKDQEKAQAAQA